MAVTAYQEKCIRALRQRGVGYRTIAAELGISRDTVRNFCTSHDLSGVAGEQPVQTGSVCPQCGGEIIQPQRERRRRFCTDACCRSWWAAHPEAIHQRPEAQRHFRCVYCGREFIVYGSAQRRYCCHNCYIRDRFWRAEEDREPYSPPKRAFDTENYIDKEPVIYRDLGDYDIEISGGHTKEQTISIFVWCKEPRQIVEAHTRMPQCLRQIRLLLDDITTRYTKKEEKDNEENHDC